MHLGNLMRIRSNTANELCVDRSVAGGKA